MSTKGGTRAGGRVHPKGENGASQALGSPWSTPTRSREGHMPCFNMNGCRKQSFPLAAPPNCMFMAAFCSSALTLSEQKLVRKWAWLDSRITMKILAMPGPVAVRISEPEKMTGLEIRYV